MLKLEIHTHNPKENLAFEESLLPLGREVFMLWRNSPSVIAGRFVNIDEEINTDFAALHGIPIVRRKSGGGAVYHDLGNINYTFIMMQYHHGGYMLHHGTLLFDADLSMIPKVLKKPGSVGNIRPLLKNDINIHEFMRRIHDYVQE